MPRYGISTSTAVAKIKKSLVVKTNFKTIIARNIFFAIMVFFLEGKNMENIEIIKKIKKEKNELSDKMYKLENFILSEDFNKISSTQKDLLLSQRIAMKTYCDILLLRVLDLRGVSDVP